MKTMLLIIIATGSLLAACSDKTQTQAYYEAHPDEAKAVAKECHARGGRKSDNCVNAILAVDVAQKKYNSNTGKDFKSWDIK